MAASFVVEDGTGLATANAYMSLADAAQYHLDRGNAAWADAADADAKTALVRATDYIDSHRIKRQECPVDEGQALKFPIEGIGVPRNVKRACAEYALIALSGDLYPDVDRNVRTVTIEKRKIGPMEKEDHYSSGRAASNRIAFPEADKLLAPYIISSRRVIR